MIQRARSRVSFFDVHQLIQAPDNDSVIWWRTLSNHVKKLATMPPLQNDDDPCIRPLKEEELDPVLRLRKVRASMHELLNIVSGPFTYIRFTPVIILL